MTFSPPQKKGVAKHMANTKVKSDTVWNENRDYLKYIYQTSYDIIWNWNIATDLIHVSDSLKDVLGYSVPHNRISFKDFCQRLVPPEKVVIEKNISAIINSDKTHWESAFLLQRSDGTMAFTNSRGCVVRDKTGKATHLIGATQDISNLKVLEQKLKDKKKLQDEPSETSVPAPTLSFATIWDYDLLTDEIFVGEGFEESFGYPSKNNKYPKPWLVGHFDPDDKKILDKKLNLLLKSSASSCEQTYRFFRADGSIAMLLLKVNTIRNKEGKAYRLIGTMIDITRQTIPENKMKEEIITNEKMVTAIINAWNDKTFFIRQGNQIKKVEWTKIICFITQGKYTKVQTIDSASYLIRYSLQNILLTILPQHLRASFWQINRSEVINSTHIEGIVDNKIINTEYGSFSISESYMKKVKLSINLIN